METPAPKLAFKPPSLKGGSFKPMGKVVGIAPAPAAGGHVHGPGCNHDADDHGHDHHGHAHGPPVERAAGDRVCDGNTAIQLDLGFHLAGEQDEAGRFDQLRRALCALPGVAQVHIRRDGGHAEICVHHDATVGSLDLIAKASAEAGKIAARFRAKTWYVSNMESAQCAMAIEHILGRTPGILQANVAYAAERLVVELDGDRISERQIEAKLAAMGYPLEEPEAGHACSHHAHGQSGLAPRLEVPLSIVAGVLLVLGWALEAGGVLAPEYTRFLYAGALVSGGFFATRGALLSLKARQADIETLMVLAGLGAAILGAWFEAAFLLFLFSVGHALEHRAMERARQAVDALGKLRPDVAKVKRGGVLVEVPANKVQIGEIVVVRPGDRLPLDGTVVDGTSSVDQATLTGESLPVPKQAGDPVFAGTMNTDGALEIRVDRLAGQSAIARVVDLVASAEARKSKAQRFTTMVERRFVPLVLIAAPVLSIALYATGTDLRASVLRGVSLLVAASPCALAISTPAAVLSAVARAARGGVLIKGGAHLEALGTVDTVAFDKTGTLTIGRPRVVGVDPFDAVTEERLLAVAAAAETLSSHPIAKELVAEAGRRNLALPPASDATAVHGKGLRATVGGLPVAIGSAALFGELPPAVSAAWTAALERGHTPMLVQEGGVFLGLVAVADTARPEARGAVEALRSVGISRTVMLSGDQRPVATAMGATVGVTEVRAPLMPEDKVKEIRELSRTGTVAMVGDGVNDAPALASAAVGIAMGGAGSDVALETADVVLMGDDLRRLPFAIGLARAATSVVRQNIVVALGVSLILVIATVFGWVRISQAVVLHEGSTLVVVANGLRLLAWKPRA